MKRRVSYVRSLSLALLSAWTVFAEGCGHSASSGKFSSIFEGGFDPAAGFRQHGYVVQSAGRGETIRNSAVGYAWRSWYGVVTVPPSGRGCEAVAELLRDGLNKSVNGNLADELTIRGRSTRNSMSGMLRYNKDGMHGDMHVWLLPDAAETNINYVIFLREEILRK